jgi:multiple sugar transport system substrate-binding protein
VRIDTLRCITWNHSRAFPPLAATAQRFEELNPGTCITWEKRSLHEFGHADISALTERFDLLIIDHPMLGEVEQTGALHNLKPMLTDEESRDLEEDSIGPSFESYLWNGKLYALPVDVAAPAASFRPDLLGSASAELPTKWNDVITLARRGMVRMPAFPADLFLNFMGMCVSSRSAVALTPESLFDNEIAVICLEQLRELASMMPHDIYQMNPLALYEQMSSTNDFAYCPFAYSYNNYSRLHFGTHNVRYADPVALQGCEPMRTILGGTGIALSARCKTPETALRYALFTVGGTIQSTIYSLAGGQGARRSAWRDPLLNQLTDNFFLRTAASIERAYVRPRYHGYIGLQETAGEPIVSYLKSGGSASRTLDEIDRRYRQSLAQEAAHA